MSVPVYATPWLLNFCKPVSSSSEANTTDCLGFFLQEGLNVPAMVDMRALRDLSTSSVQHRSKLVPGGALELFLCPQARKEGQWERISSALCRTHLAPEPSPIRGCMSPHPVIVGYVSLSKSSKQVLTHWSGSRHHHMCACAHTHTHTESPLDRSHPLALIALILYVQHELTMSTYAQPPNLIHSHPHIPAFCWTPQNCHSVGHFLWLTRMHTGPHKVTAISPGAHNHTCAYTRHMPDLLVVPPSLPDPGCGRCGSELNHCHHQGCY